MLHDLQYYGHGRGGGIQIPPDKLYPLVHVMQLVAEVHEVQPTLHAIHCPAER